MAKRKYQEGGRVEEEFDITQLGTPVGPAAPEEQADLGRATDLSFLGEAARDPSAGAEQAVELVRSGELGGLEIPRQSMFSDYPLEPGESRASKELPELFTGGVEMDPEYERITSMLEDPEASFWQRAAAISMMRERDEFNVPATRRVGSGVLDDLGADEKLMLSTAALTMHDPAEIAMMLQQTDEFGQRKWPHLAITEAPDGTLVVTNTNNNAAAVINRPGFSAMDAHQLAAMGAAFYPAGRITSAAASLPGRLFRGAATAGATEYGIQEFQEAAGGQFDHLDVALSAGIGPAIDLVRPTIGLFQRGGRFIGSYLPENFFGIKTAFEGLEQIVGERKAAMLRFADRASEYLRSGRPLIVTTQDAVPEAHTPFRQLILKMVERMPLTGTGALRTAERNERVEILRHLADTYGLNLNTNYGHQVIENINRNAGRRATQARLGIDRAVDEMADQDIILRDFRLTIRDLIESEQSRGTLGNQGVIDLLNKVRNQIWQGVGTAPGDKLPRGFGQMNDWLEYLYTQANNAPPNARAQLNEVANALRRDLARHATEEGGEAGARYMANQQALQDLVMNETRKTLGDLIERGEVSQQVMRQVLNSGDQNLINQMIGSLSEEGVNAARQQYLRSGLYNAGWRGGSVADMTADMVDADKFLKYLDANADEIRMLWPDEADQQMFTGMREYLRMTRAAQETGRGIGMAAAAQGTIGTGMNLVTLGLAGFAGQAYQSRPIRNLLLRLEHIKDDPRAKDAIMRQLTPLLMAAGRNLSQEWNASDPHDMIYVSDSLLEEEGFSPTGRTMINPTGQPAPGLGPGIQISPEAFQGGEEGPGVTGRLLQMLGIGGDEEEEAPPEE